MNRMTGAKNARNTASITNNTCIYGHMGGLSTSSKTPGLVYNNATNSFTVPDNTPAGYSMWPTLPCRRAPGATGIVVNGVTVYTMAQWLAAKGLLSRNPAGSAMVGRTIQATIGCWC